MSKYPNLQDAAADMAEALETLIRFESSIGHGPARVGVHQARAALARARGDAPEHDGIEQESAPRRPGAAG